MSQSGESDRIQSLLDATENNEMVTVKELIEQGSDINETDNYK